MKTIIYYIYGIIVGIANVIPGVSGGTMMVILNIYDKLLYAISWKHYEKHLAFLVTLGLGVISGILLFSHAMTYLLEYYTLPVYYSFIGLILGSIPMIYKKARHERTKPRNIVVFFIALTFMLAVNYFNQKSINIGFVSENDSFLSIIWLIIASAISTLAMILPGLSGSLILLILGPYTSVMEAIAVLDIQILLPFGIGVLIGGFFGIKLIKKLLRFHPQALYLAILGLIIGSVPVIYPGHPTQNQGILSLVLAVLFASIAYFFSVKNPE